MNWVAAIPLLPALTFVVLLPMSREVRRYGAYLSVGAMAASFLLSVTAFMRVWPGGSEEPIWDDARGRSRPSAPRPSSSGFG